MANLLGLHWIPIHVGNLNGVLEWALLERLGLQFVKIITTDLKVPYLELVPPDATIIVRYHWLSEDGIRGTTVSTPTSNTEADHPASISAYAYPEARPPLFLDTSDASRYWTSSRLSAVHLATETAFARGQRHAKICDDSAGYCESQGVPRRRLRFEGLNELQLWAGEPPAWSADYYRGFLTGLHSHGLLGVVGNLGVGWPGNGGVADAPPEWTWFQPVINEFQVGDYLGLHEYWDLQGPEQNWRWWAGRFLQCPHRVPILITECGIDRGVTGHFYGGWRDLPGSTEEQAARYTDELVRYAQQCRQDGRIGAIFPFTWDIGSNHWEKFNIRDWSMFRELEQAVANHEFAGGATPPPPPPVEWQIVGKIIKTLPASHNSIRGYCRQPDGAGWNGKRVMWGRVGEPPRGSVKSGAAGEAGSFDLAVPLEQGPTYWWVECYDPVRQLTSERLIVPLEHEAAEIEFQLLQKQTQPTQTLRAALWERAKQEQVISPNVNAALQGAMFKAGYFPISNEWEQEYGGKTLVAQLGVVWGGVLERVYFCEKGHFDKVDFYSYDPGQPLPVGPDSVLVEEAVG